MNKRLLAVSAIIILFVVYLKASPFSQVVPLGKSFSEFPLKLGNWAGDAYSLDTKAVEMLKMHEYLNRVYKNGKDRVGVYVGYYATQREGGQIHSPQICLPAAGWVKVSETVETMETGKTGRINIVKALYQKDSEKELFVYWYRMKGVTISEEYKLRFYRFINSIRFGRSDAAFIRLSAPVTENEKATARLIEDFIKDFLPLLESYLPS